MPWIVHSLHLRLTYLNPRNEELLFVKNPDHATWNSVMVILTTVDIIVLTKGVADLRNGKQVLSERFIIPDD